MELCSQQKNVAKCLAELKDQWSERRFSFVTGFFVCLVKMIVNATTLTDQTLHYLTPSTRSLCVSEMCISSHR